MLLIFSSCRQDKPIEQPNYDRTDILIFLKEQQLEVRGDTFQSIIQLPILAKETELPLGIFYLDSEYNFVSDATLPVELSPVTVHSQNLSKMLSAEAMAVTATHITPNTIVYIFPNNALGKKQFQPCLRCAPETSNLYSALWLYLQPFHKENG